MKKSSYLNSQFITFIWLLLFIIGGTSATLGATFTVTKTAGTNDEVYNLDCSLCKAIGAVPGDLDTTFGVNGIVKYRFGSGGDGFSQVAVQNDGKIVVAGNNGIGRVVVIRYDADGSLDPTFVNGGVFELNPGSFATSSGLVIQEDGKIVVTFSYQIKANDYVFAVLRLDTNGSLDSAFGSNGIAVTNFTNGSDRPTDVKIQPDGKIVVTGSVGISGDTVSDVGLVRYNIDGSLDTDFGDNGKVVTFPFGNAEKGLALELQTDGTIMVLANPALIKYLPNGSLDPSFGSNGIAWASLGEMMTGDLKIQSDGKIVIATTIGNYETLKFSFIVARYLPSGDFDSSFGTDGKVTFLSNDISFASSLEIQPNGKIIIGGHAVLVNTNGLDIILARLNQDGSYDTTFGNGGKVVTEIGAAPRSDYCTDIALQKDGKILVAGNYNVEGFSDYDGVLLRYFGNAFTPTPTKPDLQAQSDTGKNNDDNLTNSRAPTFNVSGVSVGATVELLRDNEIVVDTVIASNEVVTLRDSNPPANGQASYSSRQIANNQSSLPSSSLLVTYDTIAPVLTINQDSLQSDPINTQPINFRLLFSEEVTGFDATSDISLAGSTAGVSQANIVAVSSTNTNYQIQIRNILTDGVVRASVPTGAMTDVAGNANQSSTSTDNAVTLDTVAPTVSINQENGQSDPTTILPITFRVVFSEPVAGMNVPGVISLTGSTADVSLAVVAVTGSGTSYTVSVTNVSSNGQTIRASVLANVVNDAAGNRNQASTSTDNTVTLDNVSPAVTINQSASQSDPTSNQPINFTAVFSESVTGFDVADVSLSDSTADVSSANVTVTGSGASYTISISNVISNGQVVQASVLTNGAQDALGNRNSASTSTDNTVILDNIAPTVTINQAPGQADPSTNQPINFTVIFSEPVTGFNASDISLTGSTANVSSASITVTGSGTTYNVAVGNITSNGQLRAVVVANAAQDTIGNLSGASTSTDNIITYNGATTTQNRKTVGVFRPSNGITYMRNSNTGGFAEVSMIYGVNGDTSFAGDWNGDRVDSIGIYRNGVFYLRNSNTTGSADVVFAFGSQGDQPIAGDWNGDGIDTIGVYRPTTGVFMLRNSNTAGAPDVTFVLGNPGDVAIAGDWNGDGVTTTGVFRPTNGIVYLKNTNVSGDADIYLVYGVAGDKPLAGDWDGDGQDSIGIYRGGVFYLRNSNTQGNADLVFALGNMGDEPIAGDWDGLP